MRELCIFIIVIFSCTINISASFPIAEDYKLNEKPCDNIILKNGEEISAKIIEITPDLIKYKRCNNLDGPLISIYKDQVLMLRYVDGSKELFNNISVGKKGNENSGVPIAGILSLSFSLIAFLIPLPLHYALLFAGAGFISGLGSLNEKYWGFSLAGMIIGLIDLIILYQLLP